MRDEVRLPGTEGADEDMDCARDGKVTVLVGVTTDDGNCASPRTCQRMVAVEAGRWGWMCVRKERMVNDKEDVVVAGREEAIAAENTAGDDTAEDVCLARKAEECNDRNMGLEGLAGDRKCCGARNGAKRSGISPEPEDASRVSAGPRQLVAV